MTLLARFPALRVLRGIEAWWDLAPAIAVLRARGDPIDAAMDAWIALDESHGDAPGAAAHRALIADVRRVMASGTEAAFAARSERRLAAAPADLAPWLGRVDAAVLAALSAFEGADLTQAERAMHELLRTEALHAADPVLQLQVFADAARLFDEVLRRTQDDEMLRRVIACAEMAIRTRRDHDVHPPGCLLCLDPRLQAMAALHASRSGVRYARTGDLEDRRLALDRSGHARALTSPEAPDYPIRLADLAVALGFFPEPEAVRTATELLREAARLEPPDTPRGRHVRAKLGAGLLAQSEHDDDPAILDEAIAVLRAAREGEQARDGFADGRLGRALMVRAERAGDTDILREALGFLRASADRRAPLPAGDQLLEWLHGAALWCAARYRETAERAALKTGLRTLAGALASTAGLADGPSAWLADLVDPLADAGPDAAEQLAARAGAVASLYRDTGADVYIEMAVPLFRFAIAAERDEERRAWQRNDLAVALEQRHRRRGDRRDLDAAIEVAEAAAGATARPASTLALLLFRRYERQATAEDLDRAIALLEQLLAAPSPWEPGERRGALSNLGSMLAARGLLHRDGADGDRALELHLEALRLTEEEDGADAAPALHNAAVAWHNRFRRTGAERDLDEAERLWRRSLALQPEPGPSTRHGLALVLLARHDLRPDAAGALLDESIEQLEPALGATTRGTPERVDQLSLLARALEERARRDAAGADLDRARALAREACEIGLETALETGFNAAYDWGGRASRRAAWPEAAEAYGYAIRALQRLAGMQATRTDKLAWLRNGWGVAANAAYAFAKTGAGDDAVVALEGARGLLLAEELGGRSLSHHALDDPALAPIAARVHAAIDRWGDAAERLRRGEAAGAVDADSARWELDGAIKAVRAVPGFERFLGYPTFADVRDAAERPLVYLVPAEAGGLALVVRRDAAQAGVVWLPELTEERVRGLAEAFVAASAGRHADHEGWTRTLDGTGRALWTVAVCAALQAVGEAACVFVPTGLLGLLPLSAAWTESPGARTGRRYALDDAVISFSPTAQSLAAARAGPELGAAPRLLAVQDPEPTRGAPLPYAAAEVAAAGAWFAGPEVLADQRGTIEEVVPRMTDHEVLHFACHAEAVIQAPDLGGIALAHDRRLHPAGLASLPLTTTRLAVLSACETGVYGGAAPDELVGLPAALLTAGAGAVVASLWEVPDTGTMLLMARFYELWRSGEACDAAEALTLAQRWLRDTTNAEKRAHFTAAWKARTLPEATFDAVTTDLLFRDNGARDFAGVEHWASFTLSGAW